MKRSCLFLCAFLVTGVWADAQGAQGSNEAAPEPEAPSEAAVEPPVVDLSPKGDIIMLMNGRNIIGQVLKRTPRDFQVEVSHGIILSIPRRQIDSVEYDIDPAKMRRARRRAGNEEKQDLIPGRKLSAELYEKLSKDISTPPLNYENQDLLAIVNDLNKRVGTAIVVDQPVKELAKSQRLWNFNAAPGMTLLSLLSQLEKDLEKELKGLKIVYQYDKILLTTKEAAKALTPPQEQQEAPPDQPPPEKPQQGTQGGSTAP